MKRSFDYITAALAVVSLGCLVVLAGCGPQKGEITAETMPASSNRSKPAGPQVAPAVSFHLGEVRHIETLSGRPKATSVGAVAGGVADGVAGYRIEVRLDNGEVRHFQRTTLDGLRVGRRVRMDGSQLTPA
jgi:outer membrane lipoprotein SlyB